MTSSICSIHWFSTLPNSPQPALFINKSICPNLSSICVPVLRTSSFFDISQVYATISTPLDSLTTCNVSFSSSNFDSERAISIIEPAPLFTKSKAACLPIPEEAPVITIIFPSHFLFFLWPSSSFPFPDNQSRILLLQNLQIIVCKTISSKKRSVYNTPISNTCLFKQSNSPTRSLVY